MTAALLKVLCITTIVSECLLKSGFIIDKCCLFGGHVEDMRAEYVNTQSDGLHFLRDDTKIYVITTLLW